MTLSAHFCTSREGVLVCALPEFIYTPAQGNSVPPKRKKVMINHPYVHSHSVNLSSFHRMLSRHICVM